MMIRKKKRSTFTCFDQRIKKEKKEKYCKFNSMQDFIDCSKNVLIFKQLNPGSKLSIETKIPLDRREKCYLSNKLVKSVTIGSISPHQLRPPQRNAAPTSNLLNRFSEILAIYCDAYHRSYAKDVARSPRLERIQISAFIIDYRVTFDPLKRISFEIFQDFKEIFFMVYRPTALITFPCLLSRILTTALP